VVRLPVDREIQERARQPSWERPRPPPQNVIEVEGDRLPDLHSDANGLTPGATVPLTAFVAPGTPCSRRAPGPQATRGRLHTFVALRLDHRRRR